MYNAAATAQSNTQPNNISHISYKAIALLETNILKDTLALSLQQTKEVYIVNTWYYQKIAELTNSNYPPEQIKNLKTSYNSERIAKFQTKLSPIQIQKYYGFINRRELRKRNRKDPLN